MNRQIWIPASSVLQLTMIPTSMCSWIYRHPASDKFEVVDHDPLTREELEASYYWQRYSLYWKQDDPAPTNPWHRAHVEIMVTRGNDHTVYFKSDEDAYQWLTHVLSKGQLDWLDITPKEYE